MVTEDADAETIRRERYEAAVGIADGETSASHETPGVPAHTLLRRLLDHSAFRRTQEERQGSPSGPRKDPTTVALKTVRAATESGDLCRWYDDEADVWRYTPTDSEKLKQIVAWQNDRDEPNTEQIEHVVAVKQEVGA